MTSMTASAQSPSIEAWDHKAARISDQYRAEALSTLPADRATAERMLRNLYAREGLPAPKCLWFDGPLSCMLAFEVMRRLDLREAPRMLDELRPAYAYRFRDLWFSLEEMIVGQLGLAEHLVDAGFYGSDPGWVPAINESVPWTAMENVEAALEHGLWSELDRMIANALAGKSLGDFDVQLSAQFWEQLDGCFDKVIQHDLPRAGGAIPFLEGFWNSEGLSWVAHYVGCQCAGATFKPAAREHLAELAALCGACGWWLACERVVFCSERPQRIGLDVEHRLHGESGPAIEFRDGHQLYAWHGTEVPAEWIEQHETLDPSLALTWPQIEQRRAVAEIIGWGKVLEHVPARVVDADPDPRIGMLFECDLPGMSSSRFLRVRCGTGREFVLSVPREMRTALEANAWTYGLRSEEYQLEARS
jgi:hypothetical protein